MQMTKINTVPARPVATYVAMWSLVRQQEELI